MRKPPSASPPRFPLQLGDEAETRRKREVCFLSGRSEFKSRLDAVWLQANSLTSLSPVSCHREK